MIFKNGRKPGTVSTEVVIGISLSIVVLFVALGLFSDNLSAMVSNSNLGNAFNNTGKTLFSSFNRDYSDSQINVQIMGEQGLAMLRRKANNMAIEQIQKIYDGSDTSTTNANSIGYLALAIKAIVGQSDICFYMKKDSDKPCKDIEGTNYTLGSSSSALTLNKFDENGRSSGSNPPSKAFSSEASSVLSSFTVPVSNGISSLTTEGKYKFIRDLSVKAEPFVYSQVILIRTINTFKNTQIVQPLSSALISLLSDLKQSVNSAYHGCKGNGISPEYGESCCNGSKGLFGSHIMIGDASHDCWIGKNENNAFNSWADDRISDIKKSSKSDIDLVNIIFNNKQIDVGSWANDEETFTHLISHDHYNSITSCDILKGRLAKMNSDYKLNITIPTCNPSDWKTDDSDNP